MSHIRQYINKIWWTNADIQRLIAHRISGYIKRIYHDSSYFQKNRSEVLALVFEKMSWDSSTCDADIPLSSFAQRRPRWVLELFKEAAKEACYVERSRISLDDILNAANRYGDSVIDDVCAEFSCECSNIEKFIRAFSGQFHSYSKDDLITIIRNRIIEQHPTPKPDGLETAHFLFYCGFLYARENHADGSYTPFYFSDKPYLLTKSSHEDRNYAWEIELIYRRPLRTTPRPQKETFREKVTRIVRSK